MFTVLVTNTKGGCGKTTLATGIASAFAQSGYNTTIADCDRQMASYQWAERRSPKLAHVNAVRWKNNTPLSVGKDTERLVIDVPGNLRRKQVKEFVRKADIVLLPVLPSSFDEMVTSRYLSELGRLKSLRNGQRVIRVVGNRVKTRTKAAGRLEGFLNNIGFPAISNIRETQLYPEAAREGMSLFDSNTKRSASFATDWYPLFCFIDSVVAGTPPMGQGFTDTG